MWWAVEQHKSMYTGQLQTHVITFDTQEDIEDYADQWEAEHLEQIAIYEELVRFSKK